MSLHDLGGGRWAVRWRDHEGRNRSRTFRDRGEAVLLEAQIAHARRNESPLPVVSRRRGRGSREHLAPVSTEAPSLNSYLLDPFGPVASFYDRRQARLSQTTRRMEATFWDQHVAASLGLVPIDEITTVMIEDWRDRLLADGIGWSSVQRTQRLVSKVLNDAARRGVIPYNPCNAADLPKGASKPVRPLEPSEIERIANQMSGTDALAVRILGFAGVRPSELFSTGNSLGIRWQDLHLSDRGSMTMRVVSGKTGATRDVRILKPLQEDLQAHRQSIDPEPADLIIPGAGGGPWTQTRYRNWRARKWKPACKRAGVGDRRVYDLRHGFASLLIHELKPITYVAAQLGNRPQVTAETYVHVLEGLDPDLRSTAEEAVYAAKQAVQTNKQGGRNAN